MICYAKEETNNDIKSTNQNVALNQYTDIKANHWAYTAVSQMSNQKILEGYPDGSFHPDNFVTRAELCKILVKALLLENESSNIDYNEVKSIHCTSKYITIQQKK